MRRQIGRPVVGARRVSKGMLIGIAAQMRRSRRAVVAFASGECAHCEMPFF
jgi:hypothetical protein